MMCAIIPAHNEAQQIGSVLEGVRRFLTHILVIDDGSQDRTAEEARRAGAHCLRHNRQLGKGHALRTGFTWARNAGFETLITLDGDGQHDPSDIPRLVAAGKSADLVLGYREFALGRVPFLRAIGNRLSTATVSRLVGRPLRDSQCGFRWIRRGVLDRVSLQAEGFDIETELLIQAVRLGCRIVEVPIRTIYGPPGSDYRPIRDAIRFVLRCQRLLVNGSRRIGQPRIGGIPLEVGPDTRLNTRPCPIRARF